MYAQKNDLAYKYCISSVEAIITHQKFSLTCKESPTSSRACKNKRVTFTEEILNGKLQFLCSVLGVVFIVTR